MNKIFNFFVLALTVLSVHLVTDRITGYLMEYRGLTHPLKFTLIGMLITVIILYPAFKYMDRVITKLTARLLLKGSGMLGGALGIFVVFLLMFAVLYWFYAEKWFHIDALKYALSFIR